jgi:hypothetical protein
MQRSTDIDGGWHGCSNYLTRIARLDFPSHIIPHAAGNGWNQFKQSSFIYPHTPTHPRLLNLEWDPPPHQLRACLSAGEATVATLSMATHTHLAQAYLRPILIIIRIHQSTFLRHGPRQSLLPAGGLGPASDSHCHLPFICLIITPSRASTLLIVSQDSKTVRNDTDTPLATDSDVPLHHHPFISVSHVVVSVRHFLTSHNLKRIAH